MSAFSQKIEISLTIFKIACKHQVSLPGNAMGFYHLVQSPNTEDCTIIHTIIPGDPSSAAHPTLVTDVDGWHRA